MKKLYRVDVEVDVPVVAESSQEAEEIAESRLSDIVSECSCFSFTSIELDECPLDYVNCLPYREYYNDDPEIFCQDYFVKEKEDLESKNHIQEKFI